MSNFGKEIPKSMAVRPADDYDDNDNDDRQTHREKIATHYMGIRERKEKKREKLVIRY